MKQKLEFDPFKNLIPQKPRSTSTMNDLDFSLLSPLLRTLLVTDGTVTRFLEAYFLEPVKLERVLQEEVTLEADLPSLDLARGNTVLKRQVLLCRNSTKEVYTFAESFIRLDRLWPELRDDLLEGRLGMGELLRDRRMETYRELLSYGKENTGHLSHLFKIGKDETLFSRSYRIFNRQRPTILISEKFPERCFQ